MSTKDGEQFYVQLESIYIDGEDGTGQCRTNMSDVTLRKKAEAALTESEQRLKMAMDLARLVQWEYDVKTGIFSFDEQFYALYGTTSHTKGGR